MRNLAFTLAAATALSAAPLVDGDGFAQTGSGNEASDASSRGPVPMGAPNASNQEPAFAAQTRAPRPASELDLVTETVAEGLPHLWSMEFLPDGRMLAAAKAGRMLVLTPDGESSKVSGVPEVVSVGQGGLLDVALSPGFDDNRTVFFSFSEPREDGNGTSVARATLNSDADALENVEVIFRQTPSYDGNKHFGSRIAFAPNGDLFVTVGERSDTPIRDRAQDLTAGMGKVFRITPEGAPSPENPYLEQADIQPEIWSYGHRNLQSAAMDADGRLWTVEHGPKGGDELNHPEKGLNYGWPAITYGIDYDGTPIGQGLTKMEGMEQPVYYWDPVIGPSGMDFYQGDAIPEWQGAAIIGGLVTEGLVVLRLGEDGRVETEEHVPLEARVRDVKLGPDGAVYAVTESRVNGTSDIVRVTKSDG